MNKTKEMVNLWIDTDIGSDIDDALAITFAASRKEFNVVGISVVDSFPERRLKTLQALLKGIGREDIPVYKGWGEPILKGRQDAGVVGLSYEANFEGNYRGKVGENAPLAILEAIRSLDGNLVLLTIGKMTNTAIAYLSDPKTFKKLKRFVAMAGCFGSSRIEYNVVRDPYSVEVILESDIKPLFVGLDVTMRCQMDKEGRERISRKIPILGTLINEFIENVEWARERIILHDPLACAVILREDLVKKEERKIVVDLEENKGMMISGEGEGNAEVCVDVKEREFIKFFVESLENFRLGEVAK